MTEKRAKFQVGQLVEHRLFDYRGVVYDVDPVFQGTEEWYEVREADAQIAFLESFGKEGAAATSSGERKRARARGAPKALAGGVRAAYLSA